MKARAVLARLRVPFPTTLMSVVARVADFWSLYPSALRLGTPHTAVPARPAGSAIQMSDLESSMADLGFCQDPLTKPHLSLDRRRLAGDQTDVNI